MVEIVENLLKIENCLRGLKKKILNNLNLTHFLLDDYFCFAVAAIIIASFFVAFFLLRFLLFEANSYLLYLMSSILLSFSY